MTGHILRLRGTVPGMILLGLLFTSGAGDAFPVVRPLPIPRTMTGTESVSVQTPRQTAPPEAEPRTEPEPAPVRAVLPENPRAIWVVRDALTSPGKIERMVEETAKAGVTDIFLQVRGRGDAYYRSAFVTPALQIQRAWERFGPYDPLELAVEAAHARGIRVHAWINVYLAHGKGEPASDHIIRTHPEWIAVDAAGRSMNEIRFPALVDKHTEGIYLSPGSSRVVRHMTEVVGELVTRYAIDGIHLDYCRYPVWDVGYRPQMREAFRSLTGYDPLVLKHPESVPASELPDLERRWIRFKADQITAMVRFLRHETRKRNPNLLLSVAVKPDPDEAYRIYGQDWASWIHGDLVDVVAPMMYSPSRKTVERQARKVLAAVPPERVWAGVAVYNQSLASARDKIDSLSRQGMGGISIFSYNSLPGGQQGLEHLNRSR